MEQKEIILCAAIIVKDGNKHEGQPSNVNSGFVVAGRRHHNCFSTINAIVGLDEAVKLKILSYQNNNSIDEVRSCQGFITSLDRYVDRKEAWDIAKSNNQIQFGLEASENGEESILISENLY